MANLGSRSARATLVFVIGMTLVIGGLQLAIAWSLFARSNTEDARLDYYTVFLSGTVCKDELIFLMDVRPAGDVTDLSKDPT